MRDGAKDAGQTPLRFRSVDPLVVERFWAKVKKTPTCWLWTGATSANGYGQVRIDGKLHYAHRLVEEWANGPIPKGVRVCQSCGVPTCVRHLFRGHHDAKLTVQDVHAIRASSEPQRLVADRYGVAQSVISRARSGRTWKHVG